MRLYAHDAAVAVTTLEAHYTVNKSEESVVFTHSHVLAGIVHCSALTNDDVTCDAGLSAPNLNA